MDYERAIKNIRGQLSGYITKSELKSLVIGISGGIDSALCAALAQPVCEDAGIPLIGRSYPILSNKDDEKARSIDVGSAFCSDFEEKDLSNRFSTLAIMMNLVGKWNSLNGNEIIIGQNPSIQDKIRVGNAKARLRMIHLYDLAQIYGGMVLSTDNYTELLLGFWTLHGDVGDYGMIQNLWKMEVYEMARFIAKQSDPGKKRALMSCVKATPTDGLGITNSDLDQLGVETYDEADRILKIWTGGGEKKEKYADHPIVIRYERTHFKRENPYNIPRELILG